MNRRGPRFLRRDHGWSLDQKQMLIRKVYDVLPEGGALIIYESIIDDDRRQNAFGCS